MEQTTKTSAFPDQTGEVISADGTRIGYRQIGQGPGLVILHGALRASHHYRQLAEALADTFTLTIPDRRGRGLSGPAGADYGMTKEREDLSALLHQTGARRVFGHSAGGAIALESALSLPIDELVLYEPADATGPVGWMPAFEQALARQDSGKAFALVIKGLKLNGIHRLPLWLLAPVARLLLKSDEGRELAELLPTMPDEARMVQQRDPDPEHYRQIKARTLLLGGSRSPAFRRDALHRLATIIPQATLIELSGLDHNAPDNNAPAVVADAIRQFLTTSPARQVVTAGAQ